MIKSTQTHTYTQTEKRLFFNHETRFSFLPPNIFLDASLHLYKRVCPSVGPYVGPSVRWSVGLSVMRLFPGARKYIFSTSELVGGDVEGREEEKGGGVEWEGAEGHIWRFAWPNLFLVACTRLYIPLCRSVGWSVGRSVTHLFFRHFSSSFRITAPAQSHATDSAMYTALLDASLHLYKRVCPSVGPSIHRSVRPSVRPSVYLSICRSIHPFQECTKTRLFDFRDC